MGRYPLYRQLDAKDCGPACLRMVCAFYGKRYSQSFLRRLCFTHSSGTTLLGMADAADALGMQSQGVKTNLAGLAANPMPCIVQWRDRHFVVVYEVGKQRVVVGDPAAGILSYTLSEFDAGFCMAGNAGRGIALLLAPTSAFAEREEIAQKRYFSFSRLFSYLHPHKRAVAQLAFSLLLGSAASLVFPYLTQVLVDVGISGHSVSVVATVLAAQLCLVLGTTANQFLGGWLMLHVNSRMGIDMVDDFLTKLMRLPIAFFTRRRIGDLLQRIADFDRIRTFLTSSCVDMGMAVVGFAVYGGLLFRYGLPLLSAYAVGAVLYVLWTVSLLKRREILDYKRFQQLSRNRGNVLQLIGGMEEIKLNGCEQSKRKAWQDIQLELYKVNAEGLSLEQVQSTGSVMLSQVKNMVVSFLAAKAVLSGDMTLGAMMAVQYLIGQMDGPLGLSIDFVRSLQDTAISMERANEVGLEGDEDAAFAGGTPLAAKSRDIELRDVSYRYNGPRSPLVLDKISATIPHERVTAIVGASGSGKTTLVRLLLGILAPTGGRVLLGGKDLHTFDLRQWRSRCGVVMQGGYVFTDSIRGNIALSDDGQKSASSRVEEAARMACIDGDIARLPARYETIIGPEGLGLSVGQRQRVLIARAVYKDAPYLFLDEATNSLDTSTEKRIVQNLQHFYKGRTVVVIAHRLSTVRWADQILVMQGGRIVEQGKHDALVAQKGVYYNLVKDQLDLEMSA